MADRLIVVEKGTRRQEQARLRELRRQEKEQAKLSAMDQARLEVETYEAFLESLLSVHKEPSRPYDWKAVAASLRPSPPVKLSHREERAGQLALLEAAGFPSPGQPPRPNRVEEARLEDERHYAEAVKAYENEVAEWEARKALARRVLLGDANAFAEALAAANPLAEVSDLCVSAQFTVSDRHLVECRLHVKGREIIPAEAKSLTSTGKVSVRAMPKSRFHEIFQDYVCGSALRAAREVFDFLPVDTVVVTALVGPSEVPDEAVRFPVLSVVIPRSVLDGLDCAAIDPSDSMEHFTHRGDVKASRKTGAFTPVVSLTASDVPRRSNTSTLAAAVDQARALRQELAAATTKLSGLLTRSATGQEDL